MARFRKPIVRRRNVRIDSRRRRIRLKQPEDRPFHLHETDLIREEAVQQSPWWFTVHRRGVYRPKVGEDPLEARAVKSVEGYLHERIVYKFMVHRLRLIPEVDFTFQSSQFGGRLELGGIVVDFLCTYMRIALRVQGPTHEEYLRVAKDDEQMQALIDMGYQVEDITIKEIRNPHTFENRMFQIFGLHARGGGGFGSGGTSIQHVEFGDYEDDNPLLTDCLGLADQILRGLNGDA